MPEEGVISKLVRRRLPIVARVLGIVLVALLVLAGPAQATLIADYAQIGSENVVDGVAHGWGTSQTDLATQNVNVVTVAHDAPDVHIELGLPFGQVNGRQRTTNQAKAASSVGHQVVAAVNGDFWQSSALGVYAPAGLNIRNGELVAARSGQDPGSFERAALGQRADGSLVIGTPGETVTFVFPGNVPVRASGINRVRGDGQLIVYTPSFGPTTGTDASGTEVVISTNDLPVTPTGTVDGTVVAAHTGAGDTPIGPGQIVLSATGAATSALNVLAAGDRVTMQTTIDAAWQDVVTAVGGVLLYDADESPDYTDPKFQEANPRTVAGLTAQGDLLLITIDGRSETSGGMVLTDVAELMRHMGATAAINLDGGGSSIMAVDPAGEAPLTVVNAPSAHHERRVNTTLLVVSTAAPAVAVTPPIAQIVAGVATTKTDAAVRVAWAPSTAGTVVSTQLQRMGGDGLWHDIALAGPDARSTTRRFVFGKANQFRVRVTDSLGATSDWATSRVYVLRRFNETSKNIVRAGAWTFPYLSTAIGNHLAHSAFDGSTHTLSLPLDGDQIAVVAQKSITSGVVRVTVGATSALVDTHASATRPRVVVFVSSGPGSSLSVSNAATSARPNVDIDAFLVLSAN